MPMSTMIGLDLYYICLHCGSAFRSQELADQCEEHCRQFRKCKPELLAQAMKCPG